MAARLNVEIRDATYNDLPRVLDIERLSFPQPWSLNSFRRELSLSFSRLTLAVVATDPSERVIQATYADGWSRGNTMSLTLRFIRTSASAESVKR